MTDDAPQPTTTADATEGDDEAWAEDWAELGAITDQLHGAREEVSRLEAERTVVYRRLRDKGLSTTAIAAAAGVSHVAVRFALDPSLRSPRRVKRRPAAK